MKHTAVNPEELGGRPRGYAQGMLAAPGRFLFVAGQIGWDRNHVLVSPHFTPQFGQALENVRTVVEAAGGRPDDLCRLTIYVTDRNAYLRVQEDLGAVYRRVLGAHYPAMAVVEVAALLEKGALVEIEATAVVIDRQEAS